MVETQTVWFGHRFGAATKQSHVSTGTGRVQVEYRSGTSRVQVGYYFEVENCPFAV